MGVLTEASPLIMQFFKWKCNMFHLEPIKVLISRDWKSSCILDPLYTHKIVLQFQGYVVKSQYFFY